MSAISTEKGCPCKIDPSWDNVLSEELKKPYIKELAAFVAAERSKGPVYPPPGLIFNAFSKTPFDKVKVVIIGQDPYHGEGQAHGLCFSVLPGIVSPPSLQNIFKEIQTDLGHLPPAHGELTRWAEQGVLLLNAILTVRQGAPMSHQGRGWEQFTDAVIKILAARKDPLVFVLWGRAAREKYCHLVSPSETALHLVLTAPHPSPLSAYSGFFGCRHFSKINAFLEQQGKIPIDWHL